MKFIFFGTPEFAKIILEKLIGANFIPTAIITNPDRPVGRKKILTASSVKQLLEVKLLKEVGFSRIDILQPENLSSIIYHLKSIKPEFGILAAYGKIISQEIIDIFPRGIIVVHPSLLPKYRGATPIQNALLAGETKTGTTLILMDEKVDHGPILATDKITIDNDDNYDRLSKKLADLSADLLIETLPKYLNGEITPQAQDHARATYTKKFISEDGFIDYSIIIGGSEESQKNAWLKIRALNPEPGAWTTKNGRRMKILTADLIDEKLVLKKIQFESEKVKNI